MSAAVTHITYAVTLHTTDINNSPALLQNITKAVIEQGKIFLLYPRFYYLQ